MKHFIHVSIVLAAFAAANNLAHAQVGPLKYATQSINDDAIAPSGGDNDGKPEECEQVELWVTVSNNGTVTATGLTGILSTSDPEVTILDDLDSWPPISPGIPQQNVSPFIFSVKSGLTNDKDAMFTLVITAGSGQQWTIPFAVKIHIQDKLNAPGSLNVTQNNNSLQLNWQDNADCEGGYKIERRIGTSSPFSEIATVGANATGYTDNALPVSGTYYYRVYTINNFYASVAAEANLLVTLPTFLEIGANLAPVSNSAVAWADFIGDDGRLDAVVVGQDNNNTEVAKAYLNNENNGVFYFTDVSANAGLRGIKSGAAVFGDYDNVDDLDLLLSGDATSSGMPRFTDIYQYQGQERFAPISAGLRGVRNGAAAWGDYDNDGDLDILLTGSPDPGINLSEIYKNTAGSFAPINAPLADVASGSSVAWGDYDNDGDLDILLAGDRSPGDPVTKVYQNTNGSFTEIANLTGVGACAVAWGDYNNDGNLDILLAGRTSTGSGIARVYRNNLNGNFSDINAGLTGVVSGSVAWGDYDNDGDFDILLTGKSDTGPIAKVYGNTGSGFSDIGAALIGVEFSSAVWGDYDNDKDLDILLAGMSANGNVSLIYRNTIGKANTPPSAPSNLTASTSGSTATLSWSQALDNQTAQAGLTYNLRVGRTTPNGVEIVSPLSNLANGFRRVPKIGNTNHRTSLAIKNLPVGIYYWSVQAIDNAFAGSAFAAERSFTVSANRAPVVANVISNQQLTAGGNPFTRDLNAAPQVFSDPDGDPLTYSASSNATSIATASISGNTLTVTPVAVGSTTITVTANDNRGGTQSTTFAVTVISSNRAPVVTNAIANQTLAVGVSTFTRNLNASPRVFTDPDGDALTYSANSSANNIATASVSGSTLTVTRVSGGSATITVTANDGNGGITPTMFTVTVLANRSPVVANAISNQTLQAGGAPFTRDLNTSPAVFTDPDGDVLIYTASSNATTIATATISGSTLTVSPAGGGSATITITANDNRGGSVSMPFAVAVNRAPVVANAIPNQIITVGGSAFTRELNAVFNDPDGDALTYSASSSANNIATASISGNTLTVSPVAGGNATITVTASDGRGGSISTTFMVTVNRPPVVVGNIPTQTITLGSVPFTRNLNLVFADPDGDPLTFAASSSAPNNAATSISGGTLTVTAVAGGSAIITVTANDGKGGTVSMTFAVIVNVAPAVANAIPNQTLTLGGNSFTRDLNASPAVFSDPDGDALTYTTSSSAPAIAAVTISGSTLTVAPVAVGNATITVTANDNNGGTIPTTFTVTVNMTINRAPVIANAIPNQTLKVGGLPFTRDLNAAPIIFSDPDGDPLSYTASSSASNIAATNIAGGVLTVSPVEAGNAMISVTANDNRGGMVSTTFNVTVEPGNRPPAVASTIPNQTLTLGGSAWMRDLNASPAIFTDPDGDALIYSASSSAMNIATTSISGSTITVAPVAVGTATITVTANDGNNGMASTMFMVTVGTAPNRAPMVTNAIANQTLTVGAMSFTRDLNAAPAVFSDPDGDALTYTASSSAGNIATANISGTAIIVTPVAAGNATITVNANDGKGGAVSTSFLITVQVNQAPVISHTTIISVEAGKDIIIVVKITDDTGIADALLWYRKGGDIQFSPESMTRTTDDFFQGIIRGQNVTSLGIEYYIQTIDVGQISVRLPAINVFSISVQVANVIKPLSQPGGSAQNAYRLISVPIQAANASAPAILEDDLGAYANTRWRLIDLMAGQPLANKNPYVEVSQTGTFTPGKSFFLIVKESGKTIDSDAGQSIRTDKEFAIPLAPGHNLVAAPFNFAIPLNKLRLKSNGAVNLRTFLDNGWTSANELAPWEGYYLPNNSTTTVDTLFVNPNLSSSSMMSKKDGSGWRVEILASCKQARDTENFAGVALASSDHYDGNDLTEPPPIGEYVSVYFPHPEWRKVFDRYSDDMRSTGNPDQRWNFVVETNIANEMVTLRFENLKDLDANLSVFLIDEAMKYKQNLRENAVYQYQPRGNERPKEFTLIVGKEDFVSDQTINAQGVPENFVLEQNFPNPFNPETSIRFGLPQQSVVTIKIFDLAGHEIATLLDRVELAAGRHQRVWDGRDSQGRAVTSGIYFCRLTAGSFAKTMKLMVVR